VLNPDGGFPTGTHRIGLPFVIMIYYLYQIGKQMIEVFLIQWLKQYNIIIRHNFLTK
jgi:hypothetical protein